MILNIYHVKISVDNWQGKLKLYCYLVLLFQLCPLATLILFLSPLDVREPPLVAPMTNIIITLINKYFKSVIPELAFADKLDDASNDEIELQFVLVGVAMK